MKHNAPVRRVRAIMVVTVVALLVSAMQLFMIQIVRGEELADQGRMVRTSASSVQAARGTIVDAEGVTLVESRTTYHIAVNQQNILEYRQRDEDGHIVGRGPAAAAAQLAPLLGLDEAELGGTMLGDQTYVYLAKNVDAATFREIRKLGIYGIEWEPAFERNYPAGALAGSVLGSIDVDGAGNSGLELVFNDALTGTPGEESYEIGPTGAVIPGAKVLSKEAVSGQTVNTTIHADLQHAVENAVNSSVELHQAEWGSAVVMDVETFEVLALADSGNVSPSKGPQASRAIQMVYEPGSVGKILTFASALDEGAINPETEFLVQDTYTTSNNQTFTDIHEHEPLYRTSTGILAESLNTGTVMVGEHVNAEDRYRMITQFGLGQLTGIQLPGESPGILSAPDAWDGRTYYTTMFGQGYAINAVQGAVIAATIGNGGVRLQPTIVSGTTNEDGVYAPIDRPAPVEVVRPEVAQTIVKMLESVTAPGSTGALAAVDGYRMAAKTGTAEIGEGGTIANMVALFPADHPQVAISVVLYRPSYLHLAGESAAPLVQQIALDTIRALDIPPSSEAPALFKSTLHESSPEAP